MGICGLLLMNNKNKGNRVVWVVEFLVHESWIDKTKNEKENQNEN